MRSYRGANDEKHEDDAGPEAAILATAKALARRGPDPLQSGVEDRGADMRSA